MPKQNWYKSDLRDQWFDKISALKSLDEGIAALKAFRAEHLGPDRTTQELKTEANWIESRIDDMRDGGITPRRRRLRDLSCPDG